MIICVPHSPPFKPTVEDRQNLTQEKTDGRRLVFVIVLLVGGRAANLESFAIFVVRRVGGGRRVGRTRFGSALFRVASCVVFFLFCFPVKGGFQIG